jgi:hypothetical protein
MDINIKIENIIKFIEKVGFKQLYFGIDEDFVFRVGQGKSNYTDFLIYEKSISEYDKLCCRIEKRVLKIPTMNKETIYYMFNVFHVKDEVHCQFLFERDKAIEYDYETIMKGIRHKFNSDLRRIKIKKLL